VDGGFVKLNNWFWTLEVSFGSYRNDVRRVKQLKILISSCISPNGIVASEFTFYR
jgi:hypothetical protein